MSALTPEYLMQLADKADPAELWRVKPFDGRVLTQSEQEQHDAGIALRRYASHLRDRANALAAKRSLCITPLTPNSNATMLIDTPESHERLRNES